MTKEGEMSNPLHAAHYADQAKHHQGVVVERVELAEETYRVRLTCPEIASAILPGQFVMVRQPNSVEPLLGRAFAMYDVAMDESGKPYAIDIVFHIVGKMTTRLSQASAGDHFELWGPLGNGFIPRETNRLVMVAGGIGQTPFLALAKEYLGLESFGRKAPRAANVTLCYGARSKRFLAGVDDFHALGVEVQIATDDGSTGHCGLVTEVLANVLAEDKAACRVVCCGPEPMMEAVAKLCGDQNVPCDVSLETPMACGIGICFSCVTRVIQSDGTWDFKRTCVDGPVFDAKSLAW